MVTLTAEGCSTEGKGDAPLLRDPKRQGAHGAAHPHFFSIVDVAQVNHACSVQIHVEAGRVSWLILPLDGLESRPGSPARC